MNLTQAEVDALPDGTRIVVTWSGGNGPHEYVLRRNDERAEHPYALTDRQDEDPAERYRFLNTAGELYPIGPGPLTQVTLARPVSPT